MTRNNAFQVSSFSIHLLTRYENPILYIKMWQCNICALGKKKNFLRLLKIDYLKESQIRKVASSSVEAIKSPSGE